MAEWQPLPTETPEGIPIKYTRPGDPHLGGGLGGAVEVVDPKTGQTIQHTHMAELTRPLTPGASGYGGDPKAYVIRGIPARPKVEQIIRGKEEHQETKELARKEAEFEAKRIAEGKVKPEDVVLTQKGSKEILQKILREREETRPPTPEEIAEEKRHRIARLQAKITGKEVIETISKKQRLYVTGTTAEGKPAKIPEKEAKLKTWYQMTAEERKTAVALPMAEKGLFEGGVFVAKERRSQRPEDLKGRLKWGYEEAGRIGEKYFKGVEPTITKTVKKQEKIPIGLGVATVGYVGFRFIKGATEPFIYPVQTVKGFYTMVRHPVQTYKGIVTGLKKEPIGFVAEPAGTAYTFGKIGKIAKPLVKRPFQAAIRRVSKKYIPFEKTGVKVVEGVSIPTPLKKLKGFEKKTVPTVHTTLARELKVGGVIKPAELKYLKGWRKDIGQRGFYTSSPVEAVVKKLSAEGKWVKTTYKKTPIKPRYQPTLYGGYIGIGESYAGSTVRFTLLPAKSRAFIFRETFIKPTPRSVSKMPIRQLVEWQSVKAGTRVAAENIKKLSTEGQFITSPGIEGKPLIKIVAGKGALKGKFTYYSVKKPVPPLFGGEKAPSFIRTGWEFLTTEQKKILFVEAKFKEISPGVKGKLPEGKAIDVGKYAESYGARYVSVVDLSKPLIGLKGKPSSIISKPSRVSYPSVSISPSVSFPSVSVGSMVSSYASEVSSKISSPLVSKSFSSSSSKVSSSVASISSSVSSSVSSSSSSVSSSLSSASSSYSSSVSSSSSSLSSSASSSYSLGYSYGSSTTGLITSFLPKRREPTPSKAFRVELKRYGEFIQIGKPLPKGRALRLGAREARRTLGATFRIVPTEKVTRLRDIPFKPSPLVFREYKIQEGRRVPTPFTFIQFATKRLSRRGEVREIMAAKAKAPKKRKWRF